MNHWLRRRRKKESQAIKSFVTSISPAISIHLHLITRSSYIVSFDCTGTYIEITGSANEWHIRINRNKWHSLDDYGTPEFWHVIESYVQYYLRQPIELVDD